MGLVALGPGEAVGEIAHTEVLPAAACAFGPRFRTLEAPPAGMALRANVIAPFGEDFESQRPGNRRRLDQLHGDGVAQPITFAGVVAGERVARLVVAEIVVADSACRYEPVRASLGELHEQTGARDAADTPLETCADAVAEEIRDQPVGSLALRLHGAPLG